MRAMISVRTQSVNPVGWQMPARFCWPGNVNVYSFSSSTRKSGVPILHPQWLSVLTKRRTRFWRVKFLPRNQRTEAKKHLLAQHQKETTFPGKHYLAFYSRVIVIACFQFNSSSAQYFLFLNQLCISTKLTNQLLDMLYFCPCILTQANRISRLSNQMPN